MNKIPLQWRKSLWRHGMTFRHDDLIALATLTRLFVGNEPVTSSALAPRTLLSIRNFCLLNPNTKVLEFGAGLSTLMLAQLERTCKIGIQVTSVEEDEVFAEFLSKSISDLPSFRILNSPVAPHARDVSPSSSNLWYTLNKYRESEIDLVIVDGPASRTGGMGFERAPALNYVKNHLSQSSMIVLDDVGRPGEYAIAQEWRRELGNAFTCESDGRAAFFHRDLEMVPFVGRVIALTS